MQMDALIGVRDKEAQDGYPTDFFNPSEKD
jgi:hypothetical protein